MKCFPINYDFGANWDTKIVPFLDHPRILKNIRTGVRGYLNNFDNPSQQYKPKTAPASYSSVDWYDFGVLDKQKEHILEDLKQNNKLPRKYFELWEDDAFQEASDMRDKILKPYFIWNKIKYRLESYVLVGSCHWWAPTFELALAQYVEPQEKWKIRVSDKHTTVINEDHTKVFDLLYWASDINSNRCKHYIFGDELKENDPTLGGKNAFINSHEPEMEDIYWENWTIRK